MELPILLIGFRGLLNLLVLLGLGAFLLLSFSLLLREPAPWQARFFRAVALLAVVAYTVELLVRTLLMGGMAWLHAVYGLMAAGILWFVSGLEPEGWLRKSLEKPPERVGPYFFWAALVGLLLWWRFIETGIAR
ncbi:hypothetical protein DV704_07255 [Meiothermus sp. QL-1]|uniref:hypothetical protein n=1 Tax=Meiothermus sp. QL-1 TaxID=2058095 RepID=UPI000E0B1120|nr:hypothetical protein [Meiothermus sp. QL-1]RDI95362.1 hypothetical protein DV704_07255 [Meiothermus sp. QL-1]